MISSQVTFHPKDIEIGIEYQYEINKTQGIENS